MQVPPKSQGTRYTIILCMAVLTQWILYWHYYIISLQNNLNWVHPYYEHTCMLQLYCGASSANHIRGRGTTTPRPVQQLSTSCHYQVEYTPYRGHQHHFFSIPLHLRDLDSQHMQLQRWVTSISLQHVSQGLHWGASCRIRENIHCVHTYILCFQISLLCVVVSPIILKFWTKNKRWSTLINAGALQMVVILKA